MEQRAFLYFAQRAQPSFFDVFAPRHCFSPPSVTLFPHCFNSFLAHRWLKIEQ
jgi:hypothetical protein